MTTVCSSFNHDQCIDPDCDCHCHGIEMTCELCNHRIRLGQEVRFKRGWAHDDCAEQAYPYDPSRDPGIPKY